jgi:hypothetical protein
MVHRPLISCDRGPKEFRPRLHLPHLPSASSWLELTLPTGATCEVKLPPRYTRFLLSRVEAWIEDEGEIEALRGFRTKAEIARRLTELTPKRKVNGKDEKKDIEPATVPVYVYEIRTRILKAVAELDPEERGDQPIPPLLENALNIGYRIARCGLDVVHFRPGPNITD